MLLWMIITFFSFSSTISDFYVSDRLQPHYQLLFEQQFSPDDTIIVFDWHEVLQEQNYTRILFKLFLRKKWIIWRGLNPRLWAKVRELIKNEKITEKIIEEIENSFYGFDGVKEEFIDIINSEPLIEDTVQIVRDLKKAGFKIYMLSNIASETLERLKLLHIDILQMFDGIYTPSSENNYIQKPDPEFYNKFKEFLNETRDADKKILFIDDREKNILAGIKEGFYGWVFSSSAQLNSLVKSLQLVEIGA